MKQKTLQILDKKQKLNLNWSLGLYIALLALALVGIIILFGNFNPSYYPPRTQIENLKFFTIDSNILMAGMALAVIILIALKKANKIKTIDKSVYLVNLVTTTGVTLTMLITIFVLVPMSIVIHEQEYTPLVLLTGSNLFFHIICPAIAIVAYLCFFKTKENIKLVETLYPLIPVVIYSIFYMSMALTHIDSSTGKPFLKYDWYRFCQFGIVPIPFILIGMYGLTFLFSWLLWLGNKKIGKNKKASN